MLIHYPPGWNIVAVTHRQPLFGGISLFYTLLAGSDTYQPVPLGSMLEPGLGYWAYFPQGVTTTMVPGSNCEALIPAPDGSTTFCEPANPRTYLSAGQWVMVGNPFSVPVLVGGADGVYAYDSMSGYQEASELSPGHGAFVYSAQGAALTFSFLHP